jgi:hypothetical protein
MRMDFYKSAYDIAGYVIIKLYKDSAKQTINSLSLLTDDFVLQVDTPFSSMSLFDDGTILFGDERVTAINKNVIDCTESSLLFEYKFKHYSSKFYNVVLIKIEGQVFGAIHFYDENAYNVLKEWLSGYSRISN